MRAQGHSFASIASALGFADPSGASKAYHRALSRKPAQNVDQLRAQESERLEYLWRKCAELIENPKLAHSAIGKVIQDPRNPGEYLVDQSAQIAAMKEYRLQSESYRRMCGVDIPPTQAPDPMAEKQYAEMISWVQSLISRNQQLERELARLRGTVPDEDVANAEIVSDLEAMITSP